MSKYITKLVRSKVIFIVMKISEAVTLVTHIHSDLITVSHGEHSRNTNDDLSTAQFTSIRRKVKSVMIACCPLKPACEIFLRKPIVR